MVFQGWGIFFDGPTRWTVAALFGGLVGWGIFQSIRPGSLFRFLWRGLTPVFAFFLLGAGPLLASKLSEMPFRVAWPTYAVFGHFAALGAISLFSLCIPVRALRWAGGAIVIGSLGLVARLVVLDGLVYPSAMSLRGIRAFYQRIDEPPTKVLSRTASGQIITVSRLTPVNEYGFGNLHAEWNAQKNHYLQSYWRFGRFPGAWAHQLADEFNPNDVRLQALGGHMIAFDANLIMECFGLGQLPDRNPVIIRNDTLGWHWVFADGRLYLPLFGPLSQEPDARFHSSTYGSLRITSDGSGGFAFELADGSHWFSNYGQFPRMLNLDTRAWASLPPRPLATNPWWEGPPFDAAGRSWLRSESPN